MASLEIGGQQLRAQFFEKSVKQIAKRMYKFKQAVSVVSTAAWKNYFYREDTTVLSGGTGNATKGIPRGAAFPHAVVKWEKILTVIEKYGLENNIPWEDILSDDIDVQSRTLYKLAEGVTKAVDDEIWEVLTEGQTASAIQTITPTNYWSSSAATVADDLGYCKQLIGEYNYPVENLMLFLSPQQYRYVLKYLGDKGAQFPAIAEQVVNNGKQGKLMGIEMVVSNSVSASYALVCVPKVCGTWKEMVPLSTTTIEDKYKSLTVRTVEMGVTQLTDPKSCVLIDFSGSTP